MSIIDGRFHGRKHMELMAHIAGSEGNSLTPFINIGLIQCDELLGWVLVVDQICRLKGNSKGVDYLLGLIDKYLIPEGENDKNEFKKAVKKLVP